MFSERGFGRGEDSVRRLFQSRILQGGSAVLVSTSRPLFRSRRFGLRSRGLFFLACEFLVRVSRSFNVRRLEIVQCRHEIIYARDKRTELFRQYSALLLHVGSQSRHSLFRFVLWCR